MSARGRVTAAGRLSLPAEMRKRYGLSNGGAVFIEDTGDAIVIRMLEQIVTRAQAMTHDIVAGKAHVSVADFIADRRLEAADE